MDTGALLASHHRSIDAIEPADWNSLEHSSVVCPASGWTPAHVTVHEGLVLLGAMPLYAKSHSWGEFVFDFTWAEAYRRHGLPYYPKLVAATPFTPATGPRLLVRPGADALRVRRALIASALEATPAASSLHVQFPTAAETEWLGGEGFLTRLDCQFHWQNRGFGSFDDFLGSFTAEKRKKAKRERRRVEEAGVRFEMRLAGELSTPEWQRVYELHASTFHRHGHEPYLNPGFFAEVARQEAIAPRVLLARHHGDIIATAIFFEGREALYGRYWGAAGEFHSLHFEACYHQGIEYCIAKGLTRFEPGTQGEHKIARGFSPTLTASAHFIREARFRTAIERYLVDERAAIRAYAADAAGHVPYRDAVPLPDLPPDDA